jgi:hypothetical protein
MIFFSRLPFCYLLLRATGCFLLFQLLSCDYEVNATLPNFRPIRFTLYLFYVAHFSLIVLKFFLLLITDQLKLGEANQNRIVLKNIA